MTTQDTHVTGPTHLRGVRGGVEAERRDGVTAGHPTPSGPLGRLRPHH